MTRPRVFFVMREIGQPFVAIKSGQVVASTASGPLTHFLPTLLLLVWSCGCVAVLLFWCFRWRRIAAAIRGVSPLNSGREFDVLRRLGRSARIAEKTELIVSESALEPGILGIFRPTLLLPSGISSRLSDAQLEAIVLHELCHARRRDNLAAAIHMVIEAIFWFHPLVWWLGARLVDERERACDEEVLSLGSDPQIYAEGILKVCEFYLETPLFCAAGVTGSNLKKRIEAIMIHRTPLSLDYARKLLLSAVGFIVVAVPFFFGMIHATRIQAQSQPANTSALPEFTSIHIYRNNSEEPGVRILYENDGFSANNYPVRGLIREAYGVQDSQIQGPEWLKYGRYDVEAKVDSSAIEDLHKLSIDQRRAMLQPLLAGVFHLVAHSEARITPVYALVVAESGSLLRQAKPVSSSGSKFPGMGTLLIEGKGQIAGDGVPVSELVDFFARQLDRPLLDQTGLTGNYDFILQWDTSSGSLETSLSPALEQQLGLRLEPRQSPVKVLVIDNVEKPSEN